MEHDQCCEARGGVTVVERWLEVTDERIVAKSFLALGCVYVLAFEVLVGKAE